MLKLRVVTASVLAPVIMLLVCYISPLWFAIISGFIVMVAAYEWATLMKLESITLQASYLLIIFSSLLVAGVVPVVFTLSLSVTGWLIAFYLILKYSRHSKLRILKSLPAQGVTGVFVLVPFWLAINALFNRPHGAALVLFLFIIVWAADSAAYVFGSSFGRHKLIPNVSPGKTIEGLLGGLLIAFLITLVGIFLLRLEWWQAISFIVLVAITIIFSVVGDLFESVVKRMAGVKNSSNLLPGHGGVLDRIDSLTAAAPIYAFAILGLGIGL